MPRSLREISEQAKNQTVPSVQPPSSGSDDDNRYSVLEGKHLPAWMDLALIGTPGAAIGSEAASRLVNDRRLKNESARLREAAKELEDIDRLNQAKYDLDTRSQNAQAVEDARRASENLFNAEKQRRYNEFVDQTAGGIDNLYRAIQNLEDVNAGKPGAVNPAGTHRLSEALMNPGVPMSKLVELANEWASPENGPARAAFFRSDPPAARSAFEAYRRVLEAYEGAGSNASGMPTRALNRIDDAFREGRDVAKFMSKYLEPGETVDGRISDLHWKSDSVTPDAPTIFSTKGTPTSEQFSKADPKAIERVRRFFGYDPLTPITQDMFAVKPELRQTAQVVPSRWGDQRHIDYLRTATGRMPSRRLVGKKDSRYGKLPEELRDEALRNDTMRATNRGKPLITPLRGLWALPAIWGGYDLGSGIAQNLAGSDVNKWK